MKADKRSKIELRMEELQCELERVKKESIEWQEKYGALLDECSRLRQESRNNTAYIVELETKVHQMERDAGIIQNDILADKGRYRPVKLDEVEDPDLAAEMISDNIERFEEK